MRVVVCRVDSAVCTVDDKITGRIDRGLLLFVGFHVDDDETDVIKTAKKIGRLRIFPDENGKINKSVNDIGGQALAISNFTLYGRLKNTNRPDFIKSCPAERAKEYFELFKAELSEFFPVESGIFGAHMHIDSKNDGPVTIIVESCEL